MTAPALASLSVRAVVPFLAKGWGARRTLQHFNGCVLHIPVSAVTEEQLDRFREAMEWGRTPEGIHAVIERGRRIQEITRSGGS